jgi:hypothetical protein
VTASAGEAAARRRALRARVRRRRVPRPRAVAGRVRGGVARVVVVHCDLFEDHAALGVDVLGSAPALLVPQPPRG